MTILPRLLALLAFAVPAMPAFAVSEADLLPVDQAFALTASAPSRDRIEVQWKVADGYYLYRHRTDVQVEGADFRAGKLQLPKGKAYRDEFFGNVETYHQDLTGVLPGEAAPGAESVTLKVKYQGCADAGICYPPQTRRLVVKLPAAVAAAGLAGQLGPANAGGLPRFGQSATAPSGAVEALPLPQEQAFAFEAIAYDGNQLLLRFTPAPGYYVYRDRTSMKLEGAKHVALGRPQWPKGQSHRDEHFGEVVVYFDQAEVPVPLQRSSGEAADATLKVTFQGCQKDGICYPPMTRAVKLAIPKGHIISAADLSATDENTIPTPTLPSKGTGQETAASEPSPPRGGLGGDGVALNEIPRTPPPADVLRKTNATTSVWVALLLALAGGLVLNLMPCVLPVLSLKALSLADSGRGGGHARASALWYTAGVLLSFIAIGAIALALRAAGQALGWGFQLQQPLVIGALVYLMFAVGLSLSGVFALGHRFAGAGHELTARSGPAGDFFTGVLAVVIASPCTAPFMGAALAFAFTASTPVALLVFAFLGLGLAVPFLLIGFVPGLAQRLPKPGAWMETLKHFLAFPMYLTAVWLLWVLGKQRGVDAIGLALVGLVLLALGLWWYQRLRLQAAPLRRTLAVLLLLASVVPLAAVHRLPRETDGPVAATADAVPYSAAKLAALRAEGRVVFVDMTADWCVTCKANEKAVLGREDFRASMRQADAVFMQGDWTKVDPAITQFLEAHQAVGVPLYVVFPSDGGEGEVLPTVLTQELVAKALARAKR